MWRFWCITQVNGSRTPDYIDHAGLFVRREPGTAREAESALEERVGDTGEPAWAVGEERLKVEWFPERSRFNVFPLKKS